MLKLSFQSSCGIQRREGIDASNTEWVELKLDVEVH